MALDQNMFLYTLQQTINAGGSEEDNSSNSASDSSSSGQLVKLENTSRHMISDKDAIFYQFATSRKPDHLPQFFAADFPDYTTALATSNNNNGQGDFRSLPASGTFAAPQLAVRRPRSGKKPIPAEQKDTKYFERRQRNNHAAKKSRDCRKQREDEVAVRASHLEMENTKLRAQLQTLREESENLKQMWLQKVHKRQMMHDSFSNSHSQSTKLINDLNSTFRLYAN